MLKEIDFSAAPFEDVEEAHKNIILRNLLSKTNAKRISLAGKWSDMPFAVIGLAVMTKELCGYQIKSQKSQKVPTGNLAADGLIAGIGNSRIVTATMTRRSAPRATFKG
jgi:hypothetical protein